MKSNATSTAQESAEQLLENLRTLVSEAEATLAGGAAEKSEELLSDLRSRLEAGLDRLNEYYGQAKRRVAAGARSTDATIRSHPYESLAVALGVGVLVGALIRRSN
jgi:ElaB/YqjD/DUF883 family membrane-anchored ribosome-binding protein